MSSSSSTSSSSSNTFLDSIEQHKKNTQHDQHHQPFHSSSLTTVHLRSSVLASIVHLQSSSRVSFCEGLLYGSHINQRVVTDTTDAALGGSLKKYKPVVSICRAQCTGTSQSFYNSEGNVDPQFVEEREQDVGLPVIGWLISRESNSTFSLSTRHIIVTRSLARCLEAKHGTTGAQPIVIVASTEKLKDSKGLSFQYQVLDHTLTPLLGNAKLECADRQTTSANIRPSMSLGDTSNLQLPSISETSIALENFGNKTLSSIKDKIEQYCSEEEKLARLLATLDVLRQVS